ncbi:MAG: methionyl-tRNA formyltransferase [Acidiferrobacteraceae bacterium]
MNLVFAGTPPFAVPALESIAARHHILRVVTRPDRPAGRGRTLRTSAVKDQAIKLGLPISQPRGRDEAASLLATLAPDADALVVVAFGMLLPESMLMGPRLGAVNIHASLLPRWRGAAPIARAIEAGDSETGITIMRMEAGLDTGPLLHQVTEPITAADTGATLHDRLAALGARAIIEGLAALEQGAPARPQDAACATYARKLSKEEAWIDWALDAGTIAHRIQAFNPYPVAMTRWRETTLRLFDATVDSGVPAAVPGTVIGLRADGLLIQGGSEAVLVRRLQVEGGRILDARSFANGYHLGPDERVGPDGL